MPLPHSVHIPILKLDNTDPERVQTSASWLAPKVVQQSPLQAYIFIRAIQVEGRTHSDRAISPAGQPVPPSGISIPQCQHKRDAPSPPLTHKPLLEAHNAQLCAALSSIPLTKSLSLSSSPSSTVPPPHACHRLRNRLSGIGHVLCSHRELRLWGKCGHMCEDPSDFWIHASTTNRHRAGMHVSTHYSGLLTCGMRPGTAASRCCSCDFCGGKSGGGKVVLELCIEAHV